MRPWRVIMYAAHFVGDLSCILRTDEGRTAHRLVGAACVHDFMYGEALELGL